MGLKCTVTAFAILSARSTCVNVEHFIAVVSLEVSSLYVCELLTCILVSFLDGKENASPQPENGVTAKAETSSLSFLHPV